MLMLYWLLLRWFLIKMVFLSKCAAEKVTLTCQQLMLIHHQRLVRFKFCMLVILFDCVFPCDLLWTSKFEGYVKVKPYVDFRSQHSYSGEIGSNE